MPTASMHASGPRPPVISFSASSTIDLFVVDASRRRPSRAPCGGGIGKRSIADHALGAEQERAFHRELPDRAAAPDRDGVARLDVAHVRAHVACREDIGQEQHLLVGQVRPAPSAGPTSANGTRAYSAWPPA